LRSAKVNGKRSSVHMLSAWADKSIFFRVNEKTNEIKVIPKLLDTLLIQDNIITIDAVKLKRILQIKLLKTLPTIYLLKKEIKRYY
jgi:hypothetical protein